MSKRYAYEPSAEAIKNLFDDCLTLGEQEHLAEKLGYHIEDLFDSASAVDIERGVMTFLRG